MGISTHDRRAGWLVDGLTARQRRLLRWAAMGVTGCIGLVLVSNVVADGEPETAHDVLTLTAIALSAAACLARARWVPDRRAPWLVLGIGLALWVPAELIYHFGYPSGDVPYPSPADAFWVPSYACFYAALVLLARSRAANASASLWLDGLAGALALGALAVAILIDAVLDATDGAQTTVSFNIVYPLADTVLLATLAATAALVSWRPGPGWGALTGGLLLLIVLDSIYLVQTAQGALLGVLDGMWPVALAIMATAAWRRPRAAAADQPLAGMRVLAAPALAVLASTAVLVIGALGSTPRTAVLLAAAAIAVAVTRVLWGFREVEGLIQNRRLALTDDLTGLPNRRLFIRRLESELANDEHERLGLLIFDLDGFKELNDTLGHAAGDAMLSRVGARLRESMPPDDLVARLGGDEFGVLLPGATVAVAVDRAERVRAALGEPLAVEGVALQIGASVGISVAPDHGDAADVLLRRADIAMYQAKNGRTGHAVYSPSADHSNLDRLRLAGELRRALARQELVVHYQPQADIGTGAVTAVEALVRWQHPSRGLLQPPAFLPALAQTDLARALTNYVLGRAVAQAAAWRRAGTQLTVAVNLTATDLLDVRLPDVVAGLLRHHGARTEDLELEITEAVILTDPQRAGEVLARLRALGICIALDDFGTGYSSLTHLQRLPVDTLKIDRSFVVAMLDDPAAAAIVRSTIELAHALGLRVVGEGIEDEAMWRRLAELGCDIAQGYYLSRPCPVDTLETSLDDIARRARHAADLVPV